MVLGGVRVSLCSWAPPNLPADLAKIVWVLTRIHELLVEIKLQQLCSEYVLETCNLTRCGYDRGGQRLGSYVSVHLLSDEKSCSRRGFAVSTQAKNNCTAVLES
jgi:hypothetical protein